LIEGLFKFHLRKEHHSDFAKFWNSCERYLLALAKFRNAIAHWHPQTNVYLKSRGEGDEPFHYEPALAHPVPGNGNRSLELKDFSPFIEDCQYAFAFLSALEPLAKRKPRSLPEKFRQPITRQNRAVLRPHQNPKEQQPRRPPSTPKLSSAQKRAKALKAARAAKKKT
jgi:hypothetical protein